MSENGKAKEGPAAKLEALLARYMALCHAMQSGVAMTIELTVGGAKEVEPKHLRVGVNSAMVEHGALVKLLVDKGLITEVEFYEALVAGFEREVASYEEALTKKLGRPVRLA